MSGSLPVLDLERFDARGVAERERFLVELRETCHATGFFYVAGHHVDPAVTDRLLVAARAFFALPLDERLTIDHLASAQFRGYTRLGDERTNRVADQREQIDLGADREERTLASGDPAYLRLDGPNQWPAALPELRAAVEPWLAAMESLGHRVLRAIAAAIGADEERFTPLFSPRPNVHAKLIRYPGRTDTLGEQGVGVHKDYGFLTLLLLEDGTGGLEVAREDGTWTEAPPRPGTFLVNLGEMLEVATRGYLRATRHRVVSPPPGRDRVSAPYFLNPRLDAVVAPVSLPADLEAQGRGLDDDPDNPLFGEFGRNALKGWLRAHPEVARRHYPELVAAP